jgi:hypothetical protein
MSDTKFVNMGFLEKARKEQKNLLKKASCPFWQAVVSASGDAVCDGFRNRYADLTFVSYECSNGARFVWCKEKLSAIAVNNCTIPKMEYPKSMERRFGFNTDVKYLDEAFASK